jgi:hypothetical protein
MPRRLAAFRFICHLFLGLALATLAAATAGAKRIACLSPTEPIFTEKAFLEKSIEFSASWSSQEDGDTIDLGPVVEWVFWDRLQLDLEVPTGIRIPDDSATVGSLSDVGFGIQALVYGGPDELLDYLSLRAEVDAPTGDRSKDIGGDGDWSLAVLPARYFTITDALPDLEITIELAGGFWLIPHPDEHLFSAFSYGLGFRVPVTSRTEDLGAVMLVIEHTFD